MPVRFAVHCLFHGHEAMIEDTNQPYSLIDKILGMAMDLLAAIGLMATTALFGLYYGGFFHWAAKSFPDNAVLQFLFGA
jgi:hypothetical protein